jgi:hypothetical protein
LLRPYPCLAQIAAENARKTSTPTSPPFSNVELRFTAASMLNIGLDNTRLCDNPTERWHQDGVKIGWMRIKKVSGFSSVWHLQNETNDLTSVHGFPPMSASLNTINNQILVLS